MSLYATFGRRPRRGRQRWALGQIQAKATIRCPAAQGFGFGWASGTVGESSRLRNAAGVRVDFDGEFTIQAELVEAAFERPNRAVARNAAVLVGQDAVSHGIAFGGECFGFQNLLKTPKGGVAVRIFHGVGPVGDVDARPLKKNKGLGPGHVAVPIEHARPHG